MSTASCPHTALAHRNSSVEPAALPHGLIVQASSCHAFPATPSLWEQMQDKTQISQDLGTPAARKEQSQRVLCAYKKAMPARGASGRLPAQNDSVDTCSTSDWSVSSDCLTLGEPKLATARLGRGVPSSVNRSTPYRSCLLRRCVSCVSLFGLPAHRV